MTDPAPMDESEFELLRQGCQSESIPWGTKTVRRLIVMIDSLRAQLVAAKDKYDADTATFMKSTDFIDYLKAQLAARDEAIGYVQRILERGEKNGGDRYVSEALAALRRAREGK